MTDVERLIWAVVGLPVLVVGLLLLMGSEKAARRCYDRRDWSGLWVELGLGGLFGVLMVVVYVVAVWGAY